MIPVGYRSTRQSLTSHSNRFPDVGLNPMETKDSCNKSKRFSGGSPVLSCEDSPVMTSDESLGLSRFGRNSFERFGDDLCELLLSYLTFKDKIALEDVSRQWRRTIYNKQSVLRVFSVHPVEPIAHLNNHYVNDLLVPIKVKNFVSGFANNMNMRTLEPNRLKTLLTKCKRIKRIEFTRVYIDKTLFEIIGEYCPQLESIQLDLIGLEEEDIVSFGEKYGKRLKQIKFNNCLRFAFRDYLHKFCNDFGKKLLSYCQNIKSFVCEDIAIIGDKNANFLPKLESIELKLKRNESNHFSNFVDKYENKLKRMRLYSTEVEFTTLRNTLQLISRFRNMEHLELHYQMILQHFHGTQSNNSITDKMAEIAKSCSKLTRLVLNINFFMPPNEFHSGNIWECIGKFHNLRKLDVAIRVAHNQESVEALKRLKNLTDLTIRATKLGDPFFKDVDQFLPNLKSLVLNSDYDLSDNLLESLSKLKCLTKISLGNGNKALRLITDAGICKLIDNCLHLRKFYFGSRPNITTKIIDKLIDFANKNSKYVINFYCGFSRMGDEAVFAPIDLNAYTNIPNNLLITLRTGQPHVHHNHQHIPNNIMAHFQDMAPPGANIHVFEFNLGDAAPPLPAVIPPPLPMDLQVLIHNHPIGNLMQPIQPIPVNQFGPNE